MNFIFDSIIIFFFFQPIYMYIFCIIFEWKIFDLLCNEFKDMIYGNIVFNMDI